MQLLKVSELKEHPRNKEFFDDMEGGRWEEFLESVKTSGVVEPIVVTETNTIVSGHQRVRACKELGIETILADVHQYNGNDAQVVKDLIETNVRQRGTVGGTDRQIVARVEALNEFYGVTRGGARKSKAEMFAAFGLEYKEEPDNAKETKGALCTLENGNDVTESKSNMPGAYMNDDTISDNAGEIKCTQCTFENDNNKQYYETVKSLDDTARLAGTTSIAYRRSRQVLSADESIVDLVEAGTISAKTVRELIIKLPKEEQRALAEEIASDGGDKRYSKAEIEEMTANYESRIAELETEKADLQAEAVEAVKAVKSNEDSRRYMEMKEAREKAEEKYRQEYEARQLLAKQNRKLVDQNTAANDKYNKELTRMENKIKKLEAMAETAKEPVEVYPDDYEELKKKAEAYDKQLQLVCNDRDGNVGLPEAEKQRKYELNLEMTLGRAASELRGAYTEIDRVCGFSPVHKQNFTNTIDELLEMLEGFKAAMETAQTNEKESA